MAGDHGDGARVPRSGRTVVACGLAVTACGSGDAERDSAAASTSTTGAPTSSVASTTGAPSTSAASTTTVAASTVAPSAVASSTSAAPTTSTLLSGDIAITGFDYGYLPAPAEVAVGSRLVFDNISDKEVHEIVVWHIPDTETRPVKELLAQPQDEWAFFDGPPRSGVGGRPGGERHRGGDLR